MSTGKVTAIAFFVSLVTATGVQLGFRYWETGATFQRTVSVPPVGGLDVGQARTVIESQGLVLVMTRTAESAEVQAGRVISQSPLQGSRVKISTPVAVVVSKGAGKTRVPTVSGLTVAEAMTMLQKSDLRAGQVRRVADPKQPKERVVGSRPPADAELARGSAVELLVSAGPPQTEVPAVTGRSARKAKEALEAAGFKLGKTRYAYDDDRRPGIVLRQQPAAGSKAAPGAAVDLVVNRD